MNHIFPGEWRKYRKDWTFLKLYDSTINTRVTDCTFYSEFEIFESINFSFFKYFVKMPGRRNFLNDTRFVGFCV